VENNKSQSNESSFLPTTNESIDLISIGKQNSREWGVGKSLSTAYRVTAIIQTLQKLLSESGDGFILFLMGDQLPPEETLQQIIRNNPSIDVWYDDAIGTRLEWPDMLDFVSPVNYFNMEVPAVVSSVSSISLRCLLVRKEILVKNGFLEERFISVEGAVKEWAWRLIYRGILFQYTNLLHALPLKKHTPISIEDQYRFIKYRFGQKWFFWSLMRSWVVGLTTMEEALKAFRTIRTEEAPNSLAPRDHSPWRNTDIKDEHAKVTVLIPTVERYPYLVTVLKQLEEQSILPYEVIVIDQTPERERKPELFVGHPKIGLKYFTLDRAGQCTSRNFGLLQSSGDYILFIDDDVEIKNDLIEKHLQCIRYFHADVSCGVCDEVGAGPIPKEYTFIRLSDIFPTNNGMVKRHVLEKSGLFDLAYDRGQRADGDLGARIYKTGARMILNPEIRLLHYHAPQGGLRKHKVRRVTFASSRQYITHFRLPHITELYFAKIHCSKRQQREYNLLTLLGTFSIRGGAWRKAEKIAYAILMLPSFFYKMGKRNRAASKMLSDFPKIPRF